MAARDFRARPLDVLVVDDDRTFGESLALFLSDDERITVSDIACDLGTALDSTHEHQFDLALVDVRLDTESGFQVVEALRKHDPELATLMMSGLDRSEIESEALACGADGVLQKTDLALGGHEVVLDAYLAGTTDGIDSSAPPETTTPRNRTEMSPRPATTGHSSRSSIRRRPVVDVCPNPGPGYYDARRRNGAWRFGRPSAVRSAVDV